MFRIQVSLGGWLVPSGGSTRLVEVPSLMLGGVSLGGWVVVTSLYLAIVP